MRPDTDDNKNDNKARHDTDVAHFVTVRISFNVTVNQRVYNKT